MTRPAWIRSADEREVLAYEQGVRDGQARRGGDPMTRDEAIAIIREAISGGRYPRDSNRDLVQGARLALEALAAKGAFVDCTHAGSPASSLCALDMADKLDAAGIK